MILMKNVLKIIDPEIKICNELDETSLAFLVHPNITSNQLEIMQMLFPKQLIEQQ